MAIPQPDEKTMRHENVHTTGGTSTTYLAFPNGPATVNDTLPSKLLDRAGARRQSST